MNHATPLMLDTRIHDRKRPRTIYVCLHHDHHAIKCNMAPHASIVEQSNNVKWHDAFFEQILSHVSKNRFRNNDVNGRQIGSLANAVSTVVINELQFSKPQQLLEVRPPFNCYFVVQFR